MHLTKRFEDALLYACHIHAAQKRKGSDTPYIAHLLGTAALVIEAGGDEDQAIAALLHDAAEDQGGEARLADIENRFGPRVAGIVRECTDSVEDPKPAWRPRKEAYIASLEEKSPDSLLVTLADKIYNAEAIVADFAVLGDELWDRFNADAVNIRWYYESLACAFARRLPGPPAGRFRRAVDAMHAPPSAERPSPGSIGGSV
jgi:(p)ppGpp synthase/HD superfamily hydrolase